MHAIKIYIQQFVPKMYKLRENIILEKIWIAKRNFYISHNGTSNSKSGNVVISKLCFLP